MKRLIAAGVVMAMTISGVAFAQSATIKQRQAILKGWGDASKPVGAQLRGQTPFDLAATQALLNRIIEGSKTLPDLFPEDSKTGGDTEALPAIWEDKAKFNAGYTKIGADATAALALIKDEATLKSEMPKVLSNCGACHRVFRKPG